MIKTNKKSVVITLAVFVSFAVVTQARASEIDELKATIQSMQKNMEQMQARTLPDAESAFYFSGVTYATIGHGDLVLPEEWRLFGPIEGLMGILMCGLSTAFFFAVMSRLYGTRAETRQP